ncbi:MAG: glycosyltransferase [Patescibacteria group bacterium]|nr:glycosyltransferase [Patescibacteria group bacterium]
MKVAIVYDRVNKWGGAERVLLSLHEIFPDASLYTSVYDEEKAKWAKVFPIVKTTYLQKFKFLRSRHELIPFLLPVFFEAYDFSDYDLVISVTSEFAKGIITKPNTLHICYCLTPVRYLWSGYETYFENFFLRLISKPVVNYLRFWDLIAKDRPDFLISVSHTVKDRIERYYNRESIVIYPPIKTDLFNKSLTNFKKKFFLVVSRLVRYKRVDIAILACNKLNFPLIVVGTGSDYRRLKKMAGNNVKFLSYVSEETLCDLYKKAYALIFPGEEDFGLVIAEAQLSGTPVIAYGKGGALEIVNEKTGILVEQQSVEAFCKALEEFDYKKYDGEKIAMNAQKFSENRFRKEFLSFVKKCYSKKILQF